MASTHLQTPFNQVFLSNVVLLWVTQFCFSGVEEPEAEKERELPEDHVLPGASLPDVHTPNDAEHGQGHG